MAEWSKDGLLCPRCRTPMQSKTREGVTIDKCPKCGGFWLDRGEIEAILKLTKGGKK